MGNSGFSIFDFRFSIFDFRFLGLYGEYSFPTSNSKSKIQSQKLPFKH